MASSLPISTAFDPKTGLTVVAMVNRDWHIEIYAGFDDPDTLELRSNPSLMTTEFLVNAGAMPAPLSSKNEFEYLGETRSVVGLTCGDWTSGIAGTYNCLLAWSDYGVPNARIVYTYFRVVPAYGGGGDVVSTTIQWAQFFGTYLVYSIDYSNTVFGVTAAFFNNAYHLSWAQSLTNPYLAWTFNNNPSSLGFPIANREYFFDSKLVHGPTFTAEDGRESALIWTSHW
jgi:hypothetical protein